MHVQAARQLALMHTCIPALPGIVLRSKAPATVNTVGHLVVEGVDRN